MSRPLSNLLIIKRIFLYPVCNYTLLWWEFPIEFYAQRWRPEAELQLSHLKNSTPALLNGSQILLSHPRSAEILTWSQDGRGELLSPLLSTILTWRHRNKVPDVSLDRSDSSRSIYDRLGWPVWIWPWTLFVSHISAGSSYPTPPQAPESAEDSSQCTLPEPKPGALDSGGLEWPENLSF